MRTDGIYQALIVEETAEGKFSRRVGERRVADLPPGDVLIRVHASALNYKDALSASGNRGVTKRYPHQPGIDAAGVVEESSAPELPAGARVLVTGYDLGCNTAGGLGGYIRVPAGWVVPLPQSLTFRDAMALGTAGFTATLCIMALQAGGIAPGAAPVLVTGATGGVGMLAIMMLAQQGYKVVAASGKEESHARLKELGAAEVIHRDQVLAPAENLLLRGRWAGVVDTVGGAFLDGALRATLNNGVVAACGNVASPRLDTNVYPFILRGVRLQGIDSANTPMARRLEVWQKLAGPWRPARLDLISRDCDLAETSQWIEALLAGRMWGRMVVRVGDDV